MLVYMLYYPRDSYVTNWKGEKLRKRDLPEFIIGGGSSTKAQPRVYASLRMAEKMQYKHFPGTEIKEIEL